LAGRNEDLVEAEPARRSLDDSFFCRPSIETINPNFVLLLKPEACILPSSKMLLHWIKGEGRPIRDKAAPEPSFLMICKDALKEPV
jgi:hypothetical protein